MVDLTKACVRFLLRPSLRESQRNTTAMQRTDSASKYFPIAFYIYSDVEVHVEVNFYLLPCLFPEDTYCNALIRSRA